MKFFNKKIVILFGLLAVITLLGGLMWFFLNKNRKPPEPLGAEPALSSKILELEEFEFPSMSGSFFPMPLELNNFLPEIDIFVEVGLPNGFFNNIYLPKD